MIRPIDTQILYPQAPELSNRQQTDNQKPNVQQEQFAQLMQKEVETKKETVDKARGKQKMDNNINKDHGQSDSQYNRHNKKKKFVSPTVEEGSPRKDPYSTSHFDIRI